jgi:2-keto-4-pentenoate hydratase/2-oxohepta-3-ene-1,7-dioic acid hydratase in catechol pathway
MALPIDRPSKIVCVGLNYRDHAEEQGVDLPEAPLLFAKWPNARRQAVDARQVAGHLLPRSGRGSCRARRSRTRRTPVRFER